MGFQTLKFMKYNLNIHLTYIANADRNTITQNHKNKAGCTPKQLETATQLQLQFHSTATEQKRAVIWSSAHLGNTTGTAMQLEGKLETQLRSNSRRVSFL
jgi:hypothetical protein